MTHKISYNQCEVLYDNIIDKQDLILWRIGKDIKGHKYF